MTSERPRDRDPAGRPRNARPRDALGRPLPPGAAGVEPVREDVVRTSAEALDEAQMLVDEGRAFGAHEVLESMWKQSDDPALRALWRGMAQLMVGITHHQRGNRTGAQELLRRGARSLAEVVPDEAAGLPVSIPAWLEWAATAAEAVASSRELPPPPRLTGSSEG